jgi:hypothetical protein
VLKQIFGGNDHKIFPRLFEGLKVNFPHYTSSFAEMKAGYKRPIAVKITAPFSAVDSFALSAKLLELCRSRNIILADSERFGMSIPSSVAAPMDCRSESI